MKKEDVAKIALGSLRQKARLSAEEVETRLEQVLSKTYWQEMKSSIICL
jgi:hypothetical protein